MDPPPTFPSGRPCDAESGFSAAPRAAEGFNGTSEKARRFLSSRYAASCAEERGGGREASRQRIYVLRT